MNKTVKYYSDNAEDYANKFDRSGPRTKDIDRAFCLAAKENPRVLELGCANGRDAKIILEKTNHYLGVDGAPGLLKIFKSNFPEVHCLQSDFRDLDFESETYDIVFDFASLFHLDQKDLRNILSKINSWLDDDGIFVMAGKYGEYQEYINPQQVEKIQYLYTPEHIMDLAGNYFKLIDKRVENIRKQTWYTLFLKKR